MTQTDSSNVITGAPAVRRLVLYTTSRAHGPVDEYVIRALEALRPTAERLVVIVPEGTSPDDQAALRVPADEVLVSSFSAFDSGVYPWAVRELSGSAGFDELVLTGDSWFGPVNEFGPVLDRMSSRRLDAWAMIENAHGAPEAFPEAGFPAVPEPWTWTAVSGGLVRSSDWSEYWSQNRAPGDQVAQESGFISYVAQHSRPAGFAFAAADYPSADPALYNPMLLVDDGCPVLARGIFAKYPPFLDRFAVIGRDILQRVEATGYPLLLIRQNLARTVPPKALNTTAGMLEVLPDVDESYDPAAPLRLAALVHATDLSGIHDLLGRLDNLPGTFDLFLTTTDGNRATALQRIVKELDSPKVSAVDVRVTPRSRGRDMADFFVGCRDVLLSGDYDLLIKVHSRRTRRKTVNVRRYFRRYQVENLLDSPGYTANLLALFQRDPALGVVFPPMMHIGYSTMGSGWGGLRDVAEELCADLGIHVPLDQISPLAPFGGMWIGRPESLRPLSAHRWRYGDYSSRSSRRYRDLAHVQERLVASAAAERGFSTLTVLTKEHAAISHTALEEKTDNLFATTRGWPVEQIQLMQRAGATGHGGIVALSRMYIRLNHPRLSRLLMPLFEVALRSVVAVRVTRMGGRRFVAMLRGRPTEDV